jgi:hypothetical protein
VAHGQSATEGDELIAIIGLLGVEPYGFWLARKLI